MYKIYADHHPSSFVVVVVVVVVVVIVVVMGVVVAVSNVRTSPYVAAASHCAMAT